MKKFGRFFGQSPKNNNVIRLRRVKALRSESAVVPVSPKEGANGGENGLSEAITRCRHRQNKDSRRDGGHAPPQRHPERSAATTKTRFTGRKQNKRSEFCCLPVVLRKGANGGKREGERSEQESVVPCQDKISRRVGGHVPPQRHLERSARDDENEVYGEKTE